MVLRVHQEGKRHLENIGDFIRVRMHVKRCFHHRQNGRDRKSATGEITRQVADDLRTIRRKPDFLIRLAQCSPFRRAVLRVDCAARKGDLAGMLAQRIGALRQKQCGLRSAIHHRHQHGGVAHLSHRH